MRLQDAILNINLRVVSEIISASPEEVNLLDEQRRSVLFCAIAGRDLRRPTPSSACRNAILKVLLARPELSIYALNAAMDCAQGATPLVLACSLGYLDQVNTLLSCPSVLVDTRDASGLTPLMHAVRGKHIHVVHALLRSGAKADLLDSAHRSVCEHAKHDSEILFNLERQLRLERSPHSTPTSRSSSRSETSNYSLPSLPHFEPIALAAPLDPRSAITWNSLFGSIIGAIDTEDVVLLRSTLETVSHLSPISHSETINSLNSTPLPQAQVASVINRLDEFGFAPIHHAMMARTPDAAVVDALYYAGADINLLTSSRKSALHILAEYAAPKNATERYALYSLVRHLVQDFRISLRHRDEQSETCLHVAAERGTCREILEALVECDDGGLVREFKNNRNLKPMEIVKEQYYDVFEVRPDSVCTLRPFRPKRSLAAKGSIASITSFSSVSSVTSCAAMSSSASSDQTTVPFTPMSFKEALEGSQMLLDEIDLSLLQRTLFYRSSLEIQQAENYSGIDEGLSNTSDAVIAYWVSCLSSIQRELDSTQKSVVKSHLLVARTKREVDQKARDSDRELNEAIVAWEEEQIGEKIALRDQSRGRAFTAPARIAESPSDSDTSTSQKLLPFPWKTHVPDPSIASTPSTPFDSPTPLTPVTPNSNSETSPKKSSRVRVASFIKQKLRPGSRRGEVSNNTNSGLNNSNGSNARPQLAPLTIPKVTSNYGSQQMTPARSNEEIVIEIEHQLNCLNLRPSQSAPPTPHQRFTPESQSQSHAQSQLRPRSSSRRSLRKAPIVLTRVHTDLLRIEEYVRGIHLLVSAFHKEVETARLMIDHCLLRCAQAEEKEYEDEIQLEQLRSLLVVGLERKVEEMCEAIEIARKWNGLIRGLLREFRKKIKGGELLDEDS